MGIIAAARVGFPATVNRELRQARKGATVTVMPGAGEQLARATTYALIRACDAKPVGYTERL